MKKSKPTLNLAFFRKQGKLGGVKSGEVRRAKSKLRKEQK